MLVYLTCLSIVSSDQQTSKEDETRQGVGDQDAALFSHVDDSKTKGKSEGTSVCDPSYSLTM